MLYKITPSYKGRSRPDISEIKQNISFYEVERDKIYNLIGVIESQANNLAHACYELPDDKLLEACKEFRETTIITLEERIELAVRILSMLWLTIDEMSLVVKGTVVSALYALDPSVLSKEDQQWALSRWIEIMETQRGRHFV